MQELCAWHGVASADAGILCVCLGKPLVLKRGGRELGESGVEVGFWSGGLGLGRVRHHTEGHIKRTAEAELVLPFTSSGSPASANPLQHSALARGTLCIALPPAPLPPPPSLQAYIIVDEGHRLKNTGCKLNRELKAYRTQHRLLLTGGWWGGEAQPQWEAVHSHRSCTTV